MIYEVSIDNFIISKIVAKLGQFPKIHKTFITVNNIREIIIRGAYAKYYSSYYIKV